MGHYNVFVIGKYEAAVIMIKNKKNKYTYTANALSEKPEYYTSLQVSVLNRESLSLRVSLCENLCTAKCKNWLVKKILLVSICHHILSKVCNHTICTAGEAGGVE